LKIKISYLLIKAVGDANTHKMPIFEAAGTCLNPYLDVNAQSTTDTGKQFRFKAFSFDTANVDDSIEIVSFSEIRIRGPRDGPSLGGLSPKPSSGKEII